MRLYLLLAIVISPLFLLGQGGVTLTGVVEDDSGAVIPGAKVTLVNQDTNQKQQTTSDGDGNFSFKDVSPGNYLLKAEASGFEPKQKVLTVGSQDLEPLKVKLKVSEVKEELIVEADSTEERLSPASNFGLAEVEKDLFPKLPSPADDILPLIEKFIAPAARGAEGVSLVVEGVEVAALDEPKEAIRSIKVNRNPYSAAFQRPGKARAEVRTHHGSQKHYKGSLGIYARNSVFDARNAFAESTPPLNWRLVEASFAGPLSGKSTKGKGTKIFIAAQRVMNDESAVVNAVTLAGPFLRNVPTSQRSDRISARLAWYPNPLHKFSVSYIFKDESSKNEGVGGFDLPEQGVSTGRHNHKLVLNYSATLSGNSQNDLILSFKKEDNRTGSPATAPAIVVNQAFTGGPSQSFTSDEQRTFDFQDTTTYVRGRHWFLFGARFHPKLTKTLDASDFGGTFEFASLAQFAAGTPFVFRVNQGDPNIAFTEYRVSGFVQDEIRVRPDLSLTFGLRYDWQSTTDDRNNFAPRFSFAFAPGKNRKTIFRSGAGIFYDKLPRAATQRSLLYDGVRLRQVVISNPSFPNPFSGGQGISPPPSVVRIAPDIQSPYLTQASIGVERELWRKTGFSVEYSFLRGVHLFRSRNINAPLPATGLPPDPNFLNINQVESTAFLRSHALTVTFRGGLGKFFNPQVQYVFSKSTNDTGGTFSLPANNYDLRPETGPADFDQRHRFNFLGLLTLPWNFRLGSVLSVASGAPFDITTGFDDNGDTVANDRPPGVTRNTGRGPGTVQLDVRLTKVFNVSRLWGNGQNGKGHSLEFSVDAFNATNHTNVSRIVGVLSSPFFGRANSAGAARTIQLSTKYIFSGRR